MISYDYYQHVLYVINEIGQGRTLTVSCDMAGISVIQFRQCVAKDEALQELLADAEQRGNDALVDALLDVDTNMMYGHTDSKMAKVQSDNIKWVLAKRNPSKFGDRIEVKHEVSLDRAITDALVAARQRSLPSPSTVELIEDAVILDDDDALLRQLMYG